MSTRILKDKDREFVQGVAQNILAPINAKVKISEKHTVIHCYSEWASGGNRKEWDDYMYHVFVVSSKGNIEFPVSFQEYSNLAQCAWMIAHQAFSQLDGDHKSALAENLWPSSNGHLPDYKKFLPTE